MYLVNSFENILFTCTWSKTKQLLKKKCTENDLSCVRVVYTLRRLIFVICGTTSRLNKFECRIICKKSDHSTKIETGFGFTDLFCRRDFSETAPKLKCMLRYVLTVLFLSNLVYF